VRFLSLYIARPKWLDRLKMIIRNLVTLLYTTAVNLNIFSLMDFGRGVDRTRAARLGKYATRLYIILFITGLAVLTLYTIVQPETLTKTFYNPPLIAYNRLRRHYGDKLVCSCSLIASPYHQFVKIHSVFHEVRYFAS
jgi:hypothetical protein